METKDTFIFYKDWLETLNELSDEEQYAAIKAIIDYAFFGSVPEDKFIRTITAQMRCCIDRNNEKYKEKSAIRAEAGRLGGLRRAALFRQNQANVANQANATNYSKTKQNQANQADNVNDNVNDNVTENGNENVNENDSEDVNVKNKAIAYPYDEVVRLWNEICLPLPQVKKLNDSRRKKIKSRLIEFSKESNEWLPKTRELFERVVSSDFLCGEKSDWQATFDWLFDNPKNWVKVMEGNYDNERHRNGTKPQAVPKGVRLGIGEYIDNDGNRRYSETLPPVPMSAPPRPSKDLVWSRETNSWIPPGI